jgi:Bacterial extracellular solute-binding protein/TOBE domain
MTPITTRAKVRTLAGALALGAVAIAGCSSSGGSPSSSGSVTSAKVPLVVYSAQGYDHAMTTAFTKATGIQVKLDDNSTGPLLTQIEASKNNPNWGLLWVDGATAFAGLDQQGLLLKGFEPSVQWNSLGTQSLPGDKSYTPTGVTLMAALVYNKTKVTKPPTTWQELLSSQWKGDVGMNDPSQSESGATAIYITHDQAEAFALADQIGLLQGGRLGQFGRPEQIYTEPATPFVAWFTGLSGEIAVRVSGRPAEADGNVEIEPSGALLRACRARMSGGHVPSGDAVLLIRPTGVSLRGTHDDEHHLAGTVADVAFRGRGYEHAIDIAGCGRLTGIYAAMRAQRGETVGLRLDPAGCHVFAAADATDRSAPHPPTTENAVRSLIS